MWRGRLLLMRDLAQHAIMHLLGGAYREPARIALAACASRSCWPSVSLRRLASLPLGILEHLEHAQVRGMELGQLGVGQVAQGIPR